MLNSRYKTEEVLGTGTYGHVVKCLDTTTGLHVAIKVAHREAAYRRSAMNEIHVLKLLAASPTVVDMYDSFEEDGRVHIVLPILHKNMYEYLRDTKFQPVSLPIVREVGRCILEALRDLHKAGFIHCDVKPENVMMRAPGQLDNFCLIDFGAVRRLEENQYYDVQSLWYRAPEVLCGLPYTPAIDMWSVGCLLYELHTGSPLFAGNDPQEQLATIIAQVGQPSRNAMNFGKYASALNFSGAESQPVCFDDCIRGEQLMSQQFASVLRHLLQPDENHRISVTEALKLPFFTGALMKPKSPVPLRQMNTPMQSSTTLLGDSSFGENPLRMDSQYDLFGDNFNDSILKGGLVSTNESPMKGAFGSSSNLSVLAKPSSGPKSIDGDWIL